jgi:hypothetical protein
MGAGGGPTIFIDFMGCWAVGGCWAESDAATRRRAADVMIRIYHLREHKLDSVRIYTVV